MYLYVIMCIAKRQKIILASDKVKNKAGIEFDKELILKLFWQTLERGIESVFDTGNKTSP